MTTQQQTSFAVGRRAAIQLLGGSEHLFKCLVRSGWLTPVIKRHRMTLYDRSAVEQCWNRIKGGEAPPIP